MSSNNAVDEIKTRDPIYKISYDLSYKFIVRSIYDSDLKRAEISLRNIVSLFTNTIYDDITILHVNLTYEKLSIHCKMNHKIVVTRKIFCKSSTRSSAAADAMCRHQACFCAENYISSYISS